MRRISLNVTPHQIALIPGGGAIVKRIAQMGAMKEDAVGGIDVI